MMDNYVNRVIKIMLDLAVIADEKQETPFDRELGLGYRAFTSYIRKGVEDIVKLQADYCEDCISRQAVLNTLFYKSDNNCEVVLNKELQDRIKALSPVTPQPKKGRWIDIQYFKADETYYRPKCPFCSIEPKEYSNYCPNCGARMEV